MENRNGLIVDADLTQASGLAEREAAQRMIARHAPDAQRLTLGADKAYDTRGYVADLRQLNVTPHVAQNDTNRRSAIDRRTTRHAGYVVSQQKRKLFQLVPRIQHCRPCIDALHCHLEPIKQPGQIRVGFVVRH